MWAWLLWPGVVRQASVNASQLIGPAPGQGQAWATGVNAADILALPGFLFNIMNPSTVNGVSD
jgi:hypothetical protein